MNEEALAASFGVYLHIPFCTSRCDYCAFATWTEREEEIDRYVAALLGEIARARDESGWRRPGTIFFGGGTPSLLPAEHLVALIEAIDPLAEAEITVECNPESTEGSMVAAIAAAGVNRISLGVQSRRSHVLASLGRTAHPGAFHRALEAVWTAGITNYNVDLIYGAVGERTEDLAATLDEVFGVAIAPTHLSAYALTVEAGTPLDRDPTRHPDEDLQAERYELIDERLGGEGLHWYEISNWARPGSECRHNLSCWLGGEYRGVGCSAHSHVDGRRFENIVALDRYLRAATAGQSTLAREERLVGAAALEEALILRLRTRGGVPMNYLDHSLVEDGLIEQRGDRAVLTLRGRLLANEVALGLVVPDEGMA